MFAHPARTIGQSVAVHKIIEERIRCLAKRSNNNASAGLPLYFPSLVTRHSRLLCLNLDSSLESLNGALLNGALIVYYLPW